MIDSAEVSRLIGDELATLGKFIDLLQEEQGKLVAGELEGFEALAASKLAAADRLNGLSTSRDRLLCNAGYPAGREGVEAWLAGPPNPPSAAESRGAWESLLALAAEARRLNELNGKLIAERLSHNQQALSILTTATNRASLYGPDGQTRVSGGGRKLGSA
ncbi:hypothetical protein B9N43_09020 [Denitratisoma sp. DHT3]|uniref:flagella synthesis protein FlgN n=1 Tax=Denitratisoma sp. DHT3 TaxID=1981880 RepID=UPI001198480C|nr:flagellar protein FlgN [Denitratisoma sp. DHT3]QDX81371.1 hypothetical protein B9N43_09020 [Denitratisoma sp. DHT3]